MNFAYRFPAVKGMQAGREYYIAMVPLRLLSRLFPVDEEIVAPEHRAQRRINEARIPEIKKYILENSTSLTSVPVLYQNFGADLPVFAQTTDAIHFVNVSDSLATVYPESKYVKALKKEAERRYGYLELEARLMDAQEVGFPDIELPDINAQKIKLSEVDSKVIMVYFWSATDISQKMFNLDFLKTIYDDYHKKGLEIYQIALDPDKTTWAQVVKQQNLPWINVCDALGADSPYVAIYNIGAIPAAYIIADGELVDGDIVDEKSLRKLLDKLLK